MLRALVCSLVILAFGLTTLVAEDAKDKGTKIAKGKKSDAKIVKVDAKKGTLAVKMKHPKTGEMEDKTFTLAEDIEYLDSTGRVASVDIFTLGDWVLVVEREGKIVQMKKHDKKPKTELKEGKEEKAPPKGK